MSSRKPTQIYLMDQIHSKRITIPATHLLPIPEGGIPRPVPWFGDSPPPIHKDLNVSNVHQKKFFSKVYLTASNVCVCVCFSILPSPGVYSSLYPGQLRSTLTDASTGPALSYQQMVPQTQDSNERARSPRT